MVTSTITTEKQVQDVERKIADLRKQLVALRKQSSGESVEDYTLKRKDGSSVRLSELFGDKTDLIVIHNMGKRCSYCTLWADGFNGVWRHLENRAAFVLVSADEPETMKQFTEGRNWGFTCLSGADSEFTHAMGYLDEKGDPKPGVSTFAKDTTGRITRVSHTWFGPGDDFCATWHILDMLNAGADGWSPKLSY